MVLKIDIDEVLTDKEDMFQESMVLLVCCGSSYLLVWEDVQVLHVLLKGHEVIKCSGQKYFSTINLNVHAFVR